jgi:hypothetical protein
MQTCAGCRNLAPSADVRNRRQLRTRAARWCPGPESNRHGLAACGFSYPPRLSPPRHARLGSGVRHDHNRCFKRPQVPAVHSLHLPTPHRADRIGSALPRALPRGFADFDGIRPGRFRACRSIAQVRCVYQFRHRGVAAKSTGINQTLRQSYRSTQWMRFVVTSHDLKEQM